MGGTSAINSMVYVRGNRDDYNKWAQLGNQGWSYDEVLPYFIKSENNRDQNVSEKYLSTNYSNFKKSFNQKEIFILESRTKS